MVRERKRQFRRLVEEEASPTAWGGPALYAIGAGGGKIVAVGASGTALLSSDGIAWTPQLTNVPDDLVDVTWFTFEGIAPQFVAIAGSGTIITSGDGVSWTTRKPMTSPPEYLFSIASGVGFLVASMSSAPHVYTSIDGVTWALHSFVVPRPLLDVAYGLVSDRAGLVGVGENGMIVTSLDGISWTTRNSQAAEHLLSIVWSGPKGQYVAGGWYGAILTSPDGVTWTRRTSPTTNMIRAIAWSGSLSRFVGVTNTGEVIQSIDGITWTIQPTITNTWLEDIIWWNGMFIVVSGGVDGKGPGMIIRSADGSIWTQAA
jgi:hypothetical protein